MLVLSPEIAATIEGPPNIVAIPAATPIIKPQDTLPVKKPIPVAITAKVAKVLPALPVTILKALHITLVSEFELMFEDTSDTPCASACDANPELDVRIGNRAIIEAVAKEILSNCLELIFMIN
jgi:hypothetical protein